MTLRHSRQQSPKSGKLTLSAEDSLARTLATPARVQDSPESEADYSTRPSVSFAKWDQESLCWRTSQGCLLEGLTRFSGRWPRSGLMLNGIAYRLPPLVPRITEIEFSCWVGTPTASMKIRSDKGVSKTPNPAEIVAKRTMQDRFPTPTARDWKTGHKLTDEQKANKRTPNGHGCQLNDLINGQLSPMWVEWLMGFPIGHTDLEDSGTQ